MRILITGICGFVGSTLAREFVRKNLASEIIGIDNFSRPGSEINRQPLANLGVQVIPCDIRCFSDVDSLPKADWIIDAAANPSVLAGVDGKTSSRQLVEHNLQGTINLCEYCKRHNAGFVLLSTSRVYSIAPLAGLKMTVSGNAFRPDLTNMATIALGLSEYGVSEEFSTAPPVSLYGSTKIASEHLILEYSLTFGFPAWVNRCGVMAGAGQFGHPAQGIFAYWIHSFREGGPLKYIGFEGCGYQVRDCLHPRDLIPLLERQFNATSQQSQKRVFNISGGLASAMSLAQLTAWCEERFGHVEISRPNEQRPFDIPWMVLDERKARHHWGWCPSTTTIQVLDEIANFASARPDWLKLST